MYKGNIEKRSVWLKFNLSEGESEESKFSCEGKFLPRSFNSMDVIDRMFRNFMILS